MRLFYLERAVDESGVSGTGRVAEGVQFDDGICVLRWMTKTSSTAVYNSMADLEHIHGHSGKTKVAYLLQDDIPLTSRITWDPKGI